MDKRPDLQRRLITLGAVVTGLNYAAEKISAAIPFQQQDGIKVIVSKREIRKFNLDSILEEMKSGKTVLESDNFDILIDFAQYIHQQATGMTFNEHMRKKSGRDVPIEVTLKSLEPFNFGERIDPVYSPDVDKIQLNGNKSPSLFVPVAYHEFMHSVYNDRNPFEDLRATALTLKHLLHFVAHNPRILMQNETQCMFSQLMFFHILYIKLASYYTDIKDPSPEMTYKKTSLPFLALLDQQNIGLKKAAEIVEGADWKYEEMLSRRVYEETKKDPVGFPRKLFDRLMQASISYMMTENSRLPKDVLEMKISSFKRFRDIPVIILLPLKQAPNSYLDMPFYQRV